MTVVRNASLIATVHMIGLYIGLAGSVLAEEPPKVTGERMRVEGDTLIFNTDAFRASEAQSSHITYDDDNLFGDMIMHHPDVTTVVIQGGGGSTKAAAGIARKIMEFGLDTVARNRCASACSTIFLAGSKRTLDKGGWLCFHRASATAADYQEIFAFGKESNRWRDEFEFAEEILDNGQIITRDYIAFVVSRGVSLDFALQTLAYSANDAWCPAREELEAHGVLSDPALLPLP